MPEALLSVLDDLSPRMLEAMLAEPEVEFDVIEDAAHSSERCPFTCGACTQHTNSCVATGHTA
jgi:hypothetical protein